MLKCSSLIVCRHSFLFHDLLSDFNKSKTRDVTTGAETANLSEYMR